VPAILGRSLTRPRRRQVIPRAGVAGQLREHLSRVFPGAGGLSAAIGSPVSLEFPPGFDFRDRAAWAWARRVAAWLASAACSGRARPAVLHARTGPRSRLPALMPG
jgi:transposase